MGITLWTAAAGFALAAFASVSFTFGRQRLALLTLGFLLFGAGILRMLWLHSPM